MRSSWTSRRRRPFAKPKSGRPRQCSTAQPNSSISPRLVADAGYGSAEMLGWLVDERGIEPHVKVFDKSERTDGTFSRSDFAYDPEGNFYVCPGGKELRDRKSTRLNSSHS